MMYKAEEGRLLTSYAHAEQHFGILRKFGVDRLDGDEPMVDQIFGNFHSLI